MTKHLVCYDYGQGGIWLYIEAKSASEIEGIYRDLTVFETPPPWWTENYEEAARSKFGAPFRDEWLAQFMR